MARPHEEDRQAGPVFFLDRCLGSRIVADALRQAGAQVETHEKHFAKDCPDEAWIRGACEQGWVILTKDKAIRRRDNERAALERAGAAAFVMTAGDIAGPDIARAFVSALPRIRRLLLKYSRPLLATVTGSGSVTVKMGTRRGAARNDRGTPGSGFPRAGRP